MDFVTARPELSVVWAFASAQKALRFRVLLYPIEIAETLAHGRPCTCTGVHKPLSLHCHVASFCRSPHAGFRRPELVPRSCQRFKTLPWNALNHEVFVHAKSSLNALESPKPQTAFRATTRGNFHRALSQREHHRILQSSAQKKILSVPRHTDCTEDRLLGWQRACRLEFQKRRNLRLVPH